MVTQSLQVVFAICLVIIFLIIGISIYNYEYLKTFNMYTIKEPLRKKIPIFDGVKDMNLSNNEKYVTVKNPSSDRPAPNFRDINSSKDQTGGIEFTYTFWLYVQSSDSSTIDPREYKPDEGFKEDSINQHTILFVKGSDKLSTYRNLCNEDKVDYMVKCPLVKLERNKTQLTVEFNTLPSKTNGSEYIEGIKEQSKNQCSNLTSDWKTSNAHKITLGNIDRAEFLSKWILVSIVLKDTSPTEHLPTRNKARCMIYINNFLELDTYVDGSLERMKNNFTTVNINKGPLHIFPTALAGTVNSHVPSNPKEIMMGDLTYYNYSIDQSEVNTLFENGPPTYVAPPVGAGENISFGKSERSNEKKTTSP